MRVERDGGTRRREGHALSAIAEHDGVPRVVAVERLGDLGRHLVAGNAAAARRTAPVDVSTLYRAPFGYHASEIRAGF